MNGLDDDVALDFQRYLRDWRANRRWTNEECLALSRRMQPFREHILRGLDVWSDLVLFLHTERPDDPNLPFLIGVKNQYAITFDGELLLACQLCGKWWDNISTDDLVRVFAWDGAEPSWWDLAGAFMRFKMRWVSRRFSWLGWLARLVPSPPAQCRCEKATRGLSLKLVY
jgi:hypothetical protein